MSSDLKVTNIKHESSASNNLVLGSDGNISITNTLSAGTIGSGVTFPAISPFITAWARITATASGSETIANGFGIDSIARQGTGNYRIGFSSPSPVSNSNYLIFGNVVIGSTGTSDLSVVVLNGDTKTTSEFDIYVSYASTTISSGARDYSTWREIYIQIIGGV